MAKTSSLSEVKTRLPELIVGVQDREEEVVVTKNGRPAAVLINVREYARRVRRFRIVYAADRRMRVTRLIAVGHRREVYEELSARLRRTT